MKGNLMICQSGGPSPVLNATLYGVIEEAKRHPEIGGVLGSIGGAGGILDENFVDLKAQNEDFIKKLPFTPASVIKTSRRNILPGDYKRMIDILKKYNVRYLLYNGGNGSMGTCRLLYKSAGDDIKIIGLPKTIDNDIAITDHTPGFGSAARYMAVTTAEIGMDVAALPIHVCIIEAMGRNAGWIAASSILARKKEGDAPHLVYVPEKPFIMNDFLEKAEYLYKKIGGVVVVVSEGIADENGHPVVPPIFIPGAKDPYQGDVGVYLARQVWERLGIKARSEKPGIAGRASAALQSPIDRAEAIEAGISAVSAAVEGKSGLMVGFERLPGSSYSCKTVLIPVGEVANIEKKLPVSYTDGADDDINPAFLDYCRPLVGELPNYAVLENIKPKVL